MRQSHRIVNEKRLVAVAAHEVVDVFSVEVGAVVPAGVFDERTVVENYRVRVARALVLGMLCMPQEVIVEPGVFGEHTFASPLGFEVGRVIAVELPFARDAGLVSGIAHHVTERDFAWWQYAERLPVSKVVLARHELHTSGRA
jgi:hypothetical protein